jgi:hypothetical protein
MGSSDYQMIILAVLVIAVMVLVSLFMFIIHENKQVKNQMAIEMMSMAMQAQAWYRIPIMMGGGGNQVVYEDSTRITQFIDVKSLENIINNQNAKYRVVVSQPSENDPSRGQIKILGKSNSIHNVEGVATIYLNSRNPEGIEEGYEQGIRIKFGE